MTVLFSTPTNRRPYRVRVYLTDKGRVVKITAGCRCWKSFEEAFSHYGGGHPYCMQKYQNVAYSNTTDGSVGLVKYNSERVKDRNDMLLAIARLAARVQKWRYRQRWLRLRKEKKC